MFSPLTFQSPRGPPLSSPAAHFSCVFSFSSALLAEYTRVSKGQARSLGGGEVGRGREPRGQDGLKSQIGSVAPATLACPRVFQALERHCESLTESVGALKVFTVVDSRSVIN